jgi:protein gp37
MSRTTIEWATDVWNPVTGCTKVSEGCRHCYAERLVQRFGTRVHGLHRLPEFRADVERICTPPKFTHVICHQDKLDQPLHWRNPRRVFVCSMGDLFHESVPSVFIRSVFQTMALARQHAFLVLTKRPQRMLDIISGWACAGLTLREGCGPVLPNVSLGVSVEDQVTAEQRIPLLLQTPAALRFVSCEPMLGPVDLTRLGPLGESTDALRGELYVQDSGPFRIAAHVDWVICGGESGPGARPCEVRWIESVVDQCTAAGVPVFVKQLGGDPRWIGASSRPIEHARGKNADPEQWPESLRVREVPNVLR